jgi:hypothetical protein
MGHFAPVILAAGLLSVLAATGRAQPASAPLTPVARHEIVANARKALAEIYVYPDVGLRAGEKIQRALDAGDYAAITDGTAFGARLTTDLQSVTHDRHMRVFNRNGPPPPDLPPPPKSLGGYVRADRLKGNIGYIEVVGFPNLGMAKEGADAAMQAVAGTDALIIDVRRNGGGSPASVSYLCSFLFDPGHPTHFNDLIWRQKGTETFTTETFFSVPTPTHYLGKPVILIAGPRTFSGGEEFVNDLKVLKRVVVVGETTGGGANPGGMSPIGSGLLLFVPGGRAENPVTKTNWDGVGVSPDIAAAPAEAFAVAMKTALRAAPPSPARRALAGAAVAGEVDQWSEAILMKPPGGPTPAHETLLRDLISDVAHGKFDYDRMTPDFVPVVTPQMPAAQAELAGLGELKSVTFKEVDGLGSDVYLTTFERGTLEWAFFINSKGQIANAFYRRLPQKPA